MNTLPPVECDYCVQRVRHAAKPAIMNEGAFPGRADGRVKINILTRQDWCRYAGSYEGAILA